MPKLASFSQTTIKENYNLIATALQKAGFKIKNLNAKGICRGLISVYLLFAHQGQRDEFFSYVIFIFLFKDKNSKDQTNINNLVEHYKKNEARNVDFSVQIAKGYPIISFKKLIKFFTAVQDAQEDAYHSAIGAQWNRTETIFCVQSQLANHLKRVRIATESKLMYVSFGRHAFALEKVPDGFYLFEPNKIKLDLAQTKEEFESSKIKLKLLRTEEEVAAKIIKNLYDSNFVPIFNSKVALAIDFISYGDENRELDDALKLFIENNKLQYPAIISLINYYKESKLSRLDFAAALRDEIAVIKNNNYVSNVALENFDNELKTYLESRSFYKDQLILDAFLKNNKKLLRQTAYSWQLSWLYLAILKNQITFVKKLLSNGANVNQARKNGFTPLLFASQVGYLELVKILLKYGANPNHVNKYGNSSLKYALPYPEIVKILLEHGAEYRQMPFYSLAIMVDAGYFEVVKKLLIAGVNPNEAPDDGVTALFYAAHKGHTAVMEILLTHGANPNHTAANGFTALFIAACAGHIGAANILIAHGASLNYKNKYDETVLFFAVKNNHSGMTKLLLANGADPNLVNKGNEILYIAVKNGYTEIVQTLLTYGVDPNQTAEDGKTFFSIAVENNYVLIIQALTKYGVDPNQTDEEGDTALILAGRENQIQIVKTLLANGANPNQSATDGEKPLFYPAQEGYIEVVAALLDNGANIDEVSDKGLTALHFAAMEGQTEVIKLLMSRGANPNLCTKLGSTPLLLTLQKGHIETAKLLLKYNDAKQANHQGNTALHFAAQNNLLGIVKILLTYNIELNLKTKQGKTALHIAVEKGYSEIAKFLLTKGANPNNSAVDGTTTLHTAIEAGHVECVKILLEFGADLNQKNNEGVTAADKASQNGNTEIMNLVASEIAFNNGLKFLQLSSNSPFFTQGDCEQEFIKAKNYHSLYFESRLTKFFDSIDSKTFLNLSQLRKLCFSQLAKELGNSNLKEKLADLAENLLLLKEQEKKAITELRAKSELSCEKKFLWINHQN